jgi:hypothetical protein
MATVKPRAHRQSFPFLKPLTEITPVTRTFQPTTPNLSSTLNPSAAVNNAQAARVRSKSNGVGSGLAQTGVAVPDAFAGSNTKSWTRQTSSRRSSTYSRRSSMVARDPDMSRKGSAVWSELDGALNEDQIQNPEQKRRDQIARLASTFKGLWQDGVGTLSYDVFKAFSESWFSGEVAGRSLKRTD